jgi:hypothetical protein
MLNAGSTESLAILILGLAAAAGKQMLKPNSHSFSTTHNRDQSHSASIAPYINTWYSFRFFLPANWVGIRSSLENGA